MSCAPRSARPRHTHCHTICRDYVEVGVIRPGREIKIRKGPRSRAEYSSRRSREGGVDQRGHHPPPLAGPGGPLYLLHQESLRIWSLECVYGNAKGIQRRLFFNPWWRLPLKWCELPEEINHVQFIFHFMRVSGTFSFLLYSKL